jgi:hypothetical protein
MPFFIDLFKSDPNKVAESHKYLPTFFCFLCHFFVEDAELSGEFPTFGILWWCITYSSSLLFYKLVIGLENWPNSGLMFWEKHFTGASLVFCPVQSLVSSHNAWESPPGGHKWRSSFPVAYFCWVLDPLSRKMSLLYSVQISLCPVPLGWAEPWVSTSELSSWFLCVELHFKSD